MMMMITIHQLTYFDVLLVQAGAVGALYHLSRKFKKFKIIKLQKKICSITFHRSPKGATSQTK